ncbi:hypothetical protein P4132_01265 [Pseudomonas aeruginosa]|nr:hypothetical protein [Pseudomonas aeruginosa]
MAEQVGLRAHRAAPVVFQSRQQGGRDQRRRQRAELADSGQPAAQSQPRMVAADGLGVFGELVKMTFDAIGRTEQVTGNGVGGVRVVARRGAPVAHELFVAQGRVDPEGLHGGPGVERQGNQEEEREQPYPQRIVAHPRLFLLEVVGQECLGLACG